MKPKEESTTGIQSAFGARNPRRAAEQLSDSIDSTTELPPDCRYFFCKLLNAAFR